ncbi:hypothetical protein CR513_07653, partial [Mucuna pruriens]
MRLLAHFRVVLFIGRVQRKTQMSCRKSSIRCIDQRVKRKTYDKVDWNFLEHTLRFGFLRTDSTQTWCRLGIDKLLADDHSITHYLILTKEGSRGPRPEGLKVNCRSLEPFPLQKFPRIRGSLSRALLKFNLKEIYMVHDRVTRLDWMEIIDMISSRQAAWKGRLLNKLKTSYFRKDNSIFHAFIWDENKSIKRFIWRGMNNRGLHMVRWRKITRHRKKKGIGA